MPRPKARSLRSPVPTVSSSTAQRKRAPTPEPPTTRKKGLCMTLSPQRIVRDSAPETLVVFDCRDRNPQKRKSRERYAWEPSATVENLGHGRAVLIVRPGGALRLAK